VAAGRQASRLLHELPRQRPPLGGEGHDDADQHLHHGGGEVRLRLADKSGGDDLGDGQGFEEEAL